MYDAMRMLLYGYNMCLPVKTTSRRLYWLGLACGGVGRLLLLQRCWYKV
jgi:hypothetical protein